MPVQVKRKIIIIEHLAKPASPLKIEVEDKLINHLAGVCVDIDLALMDASKKSTTKLVRLSLENYKEAVKSAILYIETFPVNHLIYRNLHEEFSKMLTILKNLKTNVSREKAVSFREQFEDLSDLVRKTTKHL